MSTYTKPPVLPAWAETASSPGDKLQPTNSEISAGWPESPVPPSRQRFNWLLNFTSNAVRYFCQRGLADYDAAETYQIGARIIGDDNLTYMSLVDDNTANPPSSSPTYWKRWGLSDIDLSPYALWAGGTFTGPIMAPTPAPGDNSNRVATTAFVTAAITAALVAINSAIATLLTFMATVTAFMAGFSSSKTNPGWMYRPDGILEQWTIGAYGTMYHQNPTFIPFPRQFPNAVLSYSVTCATTGTDYGEGAMFNVTSVTRDGITVYSMRNTDHSSNPLAPVIRVIGW